MISFTGKGHFKQANTQFPIFPSSQGNSKPKWTQLVEQLLLNGGGSRVRPLRNRDRLMQRFMGYGSFVPPLSLSRCGRPMVLCSTSALVFSVLYVLVTAKSPPSELGTDKSPVPFWTTSRKISERPLHNFIFIDWNKVQCHLIFYEAAYRHS